MRQRSHCFLEPGFLSSQDTVSCTPTALKILSWNIHGARSKLDNPLVMHMISTNDIVFLSELKTPVPIQVAGYVCYRCTGEDLLRGGCALLVKNDLHPQIESVELPTHECIFLRLKCLPHTTLMACYIAPSDSTFHSFAPLAEMRERIEKYPQEKYILIGDLNARFGEARTSFLRGKDLPRGTHYKPSPDPVSTPNSNAKYILNAASSLLLLNNLSTKTKDYKSALTFRQGDRWISEIDGCLISPSLLESITDF